MLNKELTEVLGLVAEGRAVDSEPPANSSPGTGQLGLLPLKVSQPLHLLDAHAAELASPAVEALGAYVVLAADILHPQASVRLRQDAVYLLGSRSRRLHR